MERFCFKGEKRETNERGGKKQNPAQKLCFWARGKSPKRRERGVCIYVETVKKRKRENCFGNMLTQGRERSKVSVPKKSQEVWKLKGKRAKGIFLF